MELAGAEIAFFDAGIFDGIKNDLPEGDVSGVPVVRIFFDDEARVRRPLAEEKRAVADEVGRERPGGAALVERRKCSEHTGVDRKKRGERGEGWEIRGGPLKRDDERAGVGRGDAERGGVFEGTVVERGGGLDRIKQVRIFGAERGGKNPSPRLHEIIGGER